MKKQKGMALLIVILLMAIMAIIAVNINEFWQYTFNRTLFQQERIAAKWKLLGGEVFAVNRLQQSLKGQATINRGQWWASAILGMQDETDRIHFAFSDGQACFNINALNYRFIEQEVVEDAELSPREADSAPPQLKAKPIPADAVRQVFDQLLVNVGVGELPRQQITHYIETRLMPSSNGKADKLPAFIDISELRAIPGMTKAYYVKLKPLLCVLPERTLQVNINTLTQVQLPLLRALFLNKASLADVQQLLATRPVAGWQGISDVNLLATLAKLKLAQPLFSKLATTDTAYFKLWVSIEDEQTRYYLHSLLSYKQQRVTVINRQLGQGWGS